MSETAPAAAAPAPVAAAAPKPTNGATGPVKPMPVPPTPKVAPAKGPDGRFVPKAAQADGAEPVEAADSQPIEEKEEETFELKVNGKTERLTRAQLLVRAQKAEAIDDRFRELSAKEKKLNEMLSSFEADPEATYTKLGRDPAKVLEAHLAKKAHEATLTQEQRDAEQLRRERDDYKAKLEAHEAEKKAAAQAELDGRTFNQLETTLLAAAETYGLDQNPQTLEQLCDVALEHLELGISLTADQVCQEVIHRQKEHIGQRDAKILAKLPDDKLADYLGPDVIARLNKASLAKQPGPGQTAKPREPREKPPAKGFLTEAELERSLGLRK